MPLDKNQALTKLLKHGTSQGIVVPKNIREQLPWRLGETLLVTLRGAHLIVQKVELPRVPVAPLPAQEVSR
jgi:antitoxin component of MazEF toxin-antitoxin module